MIFSLTTILTFARFIFLKSDHLVGRALRAVDHSPPDDGRGVNIGGGTQIDRCLKITRTFSPGIGTIKFFKTSLLSLNIVIFSNGSALLVHLLRLFVCCMSCQIVLVAQGCNSFSNFDAFLNINRQQATGNLNSLGTKRGLQWEWVGAWERGFGVEVGTRSTDQRLGNGHVVVEAGRGSGWWPLVGLSLRLLHSLQTVNKGLSDVDKVTFRRCFLISRCLVSKSKSNNAQEKGRRNTPFR